LLEEDIENECYVRVPYTLFRVVCRFRISDEMSHAEKKFIETLRELHKHVDKVAYDLQPWQLWEKFGAFFYALRINSLIIIGNTSVLCSQILHGAKMTDDIVDICVNLLPTKVFWSANHLDANTPRHVQRLGNAHERIDWTSGGSIILNGVSGVGVDIFFALPITDDPKRRVLFVDQRKRIYGSFGLSQVKEYLESARIRPMVLDDAIVIRGVTNFLPRANFTEKSLPPFSFVVARKESCVFHGSLSFHPACSPMTQINIAHRTALKQVFKGRDSENFIDIVLQKRKEPDGGFNNMDSLEQFVKSQKLHVYIDEAYKEYLDFSA
jgi:hypothetical protein